MASVTLGTRGEDLRRAVEALPLCRHCEGCEGTDPSIADPVHHPSIELGGSCNHDCLFCYSRAAAGAGTIPPPGYYGGARPRAITLSQYGEPLMEPEALLASIRAARERFGEVRLDLQTNGTLLTPSLWSKLEGELDLCLVSVNAADRALHRRLCGRDTFARLTGALRLVGGSGVWSVARVVDLPGIAGDALPAIAELARSSGIDEVMVHQCTVHDANRERLLAAGLDLDAVAYMPGLALRVARAAEGTGMRVTLQGCVLSTMRAMDPEALPFVLRDPSSEAPRTKRERLADWPVAPSHMPRARRRPCEPR